MATEAVDLGRRRLLGAKPRIVAIRPPWTADMFERDCTRCGACVPACPESILRLDTNGYPQITFAERGCSFCGACAEACSAPVFDRARPAWNLVIAIAQDRCLPYQGVVCQSCRDACAAGAIRFPMVAGRTARPSIDTDACTGCGACVGVCPTSAIALAPAMEPAHG